MDFRIPHEAQQLREELREFLHRELPPQRRTMGIDYDEGPEGWAFHRQLKRKVAARGWLALSWPREYGGLGASPLTQAVFTEEMAYHWAPGWDVFGVRMLGPVLMRFGTEEQKARFLPPIARGEVEWCQGYSEPGTGSDLASLQTRAVVDGDDFVINGTKIWTTHGHHADWMFLLARTDPDAPKHKGISFILVDMRSPGVSVSPIVNMAGVHTINQVFFDNVRVPRENLVGELNRGWYVGMALLDHERSAIEYPAWARRLVEETARCVAVCGPVRPVHRHALAERYIETEVGRTMSYRVAWSQSQGQVSNMEASIVKLFGSELLQRAAQTAMRALGLEGQLARRQPGAPLDGWVPLIYMETIAYTIFSGSSEIQRNIIAERGLGLPRG